MSTFARLKVYGKSDEVIDLPTKETNINKFIEQIDISKSNLPDSIQLIIKENGTEKEISGVLYLNGTELSYEFIEKNMSDKPRFLAQLLANKVNRLVWLGNGIWKKLNEGDILIDPNFE